MLIPDWLLKIVNSCKGYVLTKYFYNPQLEIANEVIHLPSFNNGIGIPKASLPVTLRASDVFPWSYKWLKEWQLSLDNSTIRSESVGIFEGKILVSTETHSARVASEQQVHSVESLFNFKKFLLVFPARTSVPGGTFWQSHDKVHHLAPWSLLSN